MNYLVNSDVKKRLAYLADVADIQDFLDCLPAEKAEQLLANYLLYKRTLGELFYLTDGCHSFRRRDRIATDMVLARNQITLHAEDLRESGRVDFRQQSGFRREVSGSFVDMSADQVFFQASDAYTADILIAIYSNITGGNPRTVERALRMKPLSPRRARQILNYRHLAHRRDGIPCNPKLYNPKL